MDWFWHALVVSVIVIPVALMWVAVVIELFRRRDLSTLARFAWLLCVLIFPLFGSLVYLTLSWLRAGKGHDMTQPPSATMPTPPPAVSDLTRLDQLRRAGVLTEDEFEAGKRRVLEGAPTGSPGRHASEEASS
jgi:hypothetical protein